MCVPDLSILRSVVLGDKFYNLGAIVARRLHNNRFNGDFFASITVGESRDITQATIGSIHFPAIHYFALFIGR